MMSCKVCNNRIEENISATDYSCHCFHCGWQYIENGLEEIEIKNPYAVISLNKSLFITMTSRRELLKHLRFYRKSKKVDRVVVSKHLKATSKIITKTIKF